MMLWCAVSLLVLSVANAGILDTVLNPEGSCPMDICFAVDSSFSINEPLWQATVKKFLEDIVHLLDVENVGARVAFVTFAETALTHSTLTNLLPFGLAAATSLPYIGGLTNIEEALIKCRFEVFTPAGGDSPARKNVVVLISDGMPNRPQLGGGPITRALDQAAELEAGNPPALICPVGVGNFDMKFLNTLSTDGETIEVPSPERLEAFRTRLVTKLCPAACANGCNGGFWEYRPGPGFVDGDVPTLQPGLTTQGYVP